MRKSCRAFIASVLIMSVVVTTGCSSPKNTVAPLANLQANKIAVSEYYADGQYEADVLKIAEDADKYLSKTLQSNRYSKPAIVFDIDDTLLNNYPIYKRMGFRFSSALWRQWINLGNIPAIEPMQALFAKYVDKVDVFIITGRNVFQKAQTVRNLKSKGYEGWTSVFYKQEWDRELTARQYKARTMKQLVESDGFQIIANFGDQESDFGFEISGRNFKLPNYLYVTK